MKRALISAVLVLVAGAFVIISTGASSGTAAGTYKIDFDNSFGLVGGSEFKVAGVQAGKIQSISLPPGCIAGNTRDCFAVVTIKVTQTGYGNFHKDATCQSRPQSLIGEYFVDCDPGHSGPVLKPGSTIPVTHTTSTIPADLLQNVMRLPYRQRFTLIVNELGAAAAARSGDLQAALARAVPALTQTDNLLNLLGNDSTTLQNLTKDSDSVITALANNSKNVERFIDEAGRTASATATQQANLRLTIQRLPPLLEQLKPTLAQLGTTVTTNEPVLANLNAASGQLNRLFRDLPAFADSARPALKALGKASVTGKVAVTAATPTVKDLNSFAKPTPELAGNLAIVLHDLDDQSRAVEPDPRSPGGKGFTGLQALLGYVFNQALAINTFTPTGHVLAVDAFFSSLCSNYATPATIALAIKQYGAKYRQCYSWLGPNQPGVNETDPSDPSASVPDPGGSPPGQRGPSTSASQLTAADVQAADVKAGTAAATSTTSTTGTATTPGATSPTTSTSTSASGAPGTTTSSGPPINLGKSIGQILASGGTTGGSSSDGSPASTPSSAAATGTSTSSGASSGSGSGGQAQQLLNYLLAP
jgi:virulence factor Mce-like protein